MLVAFISFSETMLVVYLSYKVSYSWPPTANLKPFVMSVAMMSTCVACVWVCMHAICLIVALVRLALVCVFTLLN